MSLRIAVVGGGIGGLAAAGFLDKAGLGVTVYEQAARITEVGAGLVVTPNAVRLLRRLGHIEQFLDRAVPLEIGWEFRRWQDGSVLFSQRLGADCERLYGEQCYVAHRADLLERVLAGWEAEELRWMEDEHVESMPTARRWARIVEMTADPERVSALVS